MTYHFYFKNSEPVYKTEYMLSLKQLQCRKNFPPMSLSGMANCVDLIRLLLALFAYAILSETLMYEILGHLLWSKKCSGEALLISRTYVFMVQ